MKETCQNVFGGPEELIILTMANGPFGLFGNMLMSLISRGMNTARLVVMGWDFFEEDDVSSSSAGSTRKEKSYFFALKLIYTYYLVEKCDGLGLLPNEKYILFVDGTDILFQRSPEDILGEARKIRAPLLFSTERDLYPATDWAKKEYPRHYSAPLNEIFAHLNSGGWIAHPHVLKEWFRYWTNPPFMAYKKGRGGQLELVEPQPTNKTFLTAGELWQLRYGRTDLGKLPRIFSSDDQFNAAHMYLRGVCNASIDDHAHIFLSMWIPRKQHSQFFQRQEKCEIDADRHCMKSIRTGTIPAVLHFNGPAKYQFCDDATVTSFLYEDVSPARIGQHMENGKVIFLDRDLSVLPPNAVSSTMLYESATKRLFICKESCGAEAKRRKETL